MSKDLIPDIKIKDLISAYNLIVEEVEIGLNKLNSSCEIFKNVLGYSGKLYYPFKIKDRPWTGINREEIDKIKKDILVSCWRSIFCRIKHLLPSKEIDIFEKQLWSRNVPEFTENNINKILFGFIIRGEEFKKKMIDEIYNLLRPRMSGLKTNKRSALTDRCILEHVIEVKEHYMGISAYYENELWDMDKIFHLLDGKGLPKYPNNLVTVLQNATRDKKFSTDTEYFNCKWYKNGNLHINFLRMDLVTEINKIAGCDKLSE